VKLTAAVRTSFLLFLAARSSTSRHEDDCGASIERLPNEQEQTSSVEVYYRRIAAGSEGYISVGIKALSNILERRGE
jgi:hypothetical protein